MVGARLGVRMLEGVNVRTADCTKTVDSSIWNLAPPDPKEVVCHNDFAPYNCVFRNGRFAGAIDFDLCAPGPRIWDVAYTAYRARQAALRRSRVHAFWQLPLIG